MLKNLKHSIVFILIVLILLLIVFMSLAASKPVNQVREKGISIPINPIINGKWPGLGMNVFSTNTTSEFDGHIDTLLALGIDEVRVEVGDYRYTPGQNKVRAAVIRAVAKGAKIIWGVGNGDTTLTAANWNDYRDGILAAALWAQNNGVFEFQLGNEYEYSVDGTTLTVAQLISNLKSVATSAQAIFTNGNVSYTCFQGNISDWVTAGKGDIDILASNVYMEWGAHFAIPWQDEIDALVGAFGTSGTYLTEFGLNTDGLDDYSIDEAVQEAAVKEMLDYIESSGMTRSTYFMYADVDWLTGFNALKTDSTYRLIWNQAF